MSVCVRDTPIHVTHIYKSGTSYELRLASSVSPSSTRCPDMAVTPNRRLSCPAPRVLDAHPVYTVFRDVSHDALTRRSSPSIVLALYGEALAAPYIIERRPEAFHPRPVCLSRPRWTSLSGFHLPNLETLVGGSEGRRLAHTGSNGCSCTRPYRSAALRLADIRKVGRIIKAVYQLSWNEFLGFLTRSRK